ncbi:MAG: hypothetical protein HW403_382 [Dehalococcoidia bacterium]|nr:hypothetical protein [Dehalococcoidia bacterium]
MHIGVCLIRLHLPANASLKGKRQVVNSITSRVKNRFNVSIAEVEDQDLWQSLVLGISCVSNEHSHAQEVISKVVDFIQDLRLDADMYDCQVEVLRPL